MPLKWKEISDATVGLMLPEWLLYCLPCCLQSLCQLMWEDDDVSLITWAHSPNITDKFPNGTTEHSGKWPLQFPKWWQQIACRQAKSSRVAWWDKTTGQRDDEVLKRIKWENPAGSFAIRLSLGWDWESKKDSLLVVCNKLQRFGGASRSKFRWFFGKTE